MSAESTARARVREDVRRACRTATDPIALHRRAAALLQGAVRFDRWCGLVVDPATLLATGGYHEEGLPAQVMPRLLDIEAAATDVNSLPALARTGSGIGTLHRATDGDCTASVRYRDVLAPSGLGPEMRALLRDRSSAWGALVLLRDAADADFTGADLAFVGDVASDLARGLRRCLLLSELRHRDAADVPGMALLELDGEDVHAGTVTAAARRWLGDVHDGEMAGSGLPVAVGALAMRARAHPAAPVATRLRSRPGRWLTLHAELLEPGPPARVSVIIEPTRPHELAEVIAAAYGLSQRERDVARLAVSGHSTREIAQALWLSPWTVQDHLKKAFAKLGVNSRAEMTSRLFFDQYVARMSDGAVPGADGWFITD